MQFPEIIQRKRGDFATIGQHLGVEFLQFHLLAGRNRTLNFLVNPFATSAVLLWCPFLSRILA